MENSMLRRWNFHLLLAAGVFVITEAALGSHSDVLYGQHKADPILDHGAEYLHCLFLPQPCHNILQRKFSGFILSKTLIGSCYRLPARKGAGAAGSTLTTLCA